MPIIQRPGVIGLLLCDQVLFEQGTQKPTLVGIFTGIAVSQFPSPPHRFDVFAGLTDGVGSGILDLVVTHLDTDQEIAAESMELSFPDPLRVINFRFRFRQLSFSVAGVYQFSLLMEGEQLAQRRIQVYQAEGLS
jgi:hypothetical protein